MEDKPDAPPTETPVAPPAETPASRRGPGRPIKWTAPTDGTPMSSMMKHALHQRPLNRAKYLADTPAILARQRELYRARVERQKEVARKLADLTKAIAGVMMPGLPAAQASVARV